MSFPVRIHLGPHPQHLSTRIEVAGVDVSKLVRSVSVFSDAGDGNPTRILLEFVPGEVSVSGEFTALLEESGAAIELTGSKDPA